MATSGCTTKHDLQFITWSLLAVANNTYRLRTVQLASILETAQTPYDPDYDAFNSQRAKLFTKLLHYRKNPEAPVGRGPKEK